MYYDGGKFLVDTEQPHEYIFQTHINSFHYLYQDAEYLHGLARNEMTSDPFSLTRYCRTALLLYVISLEALINRVMDHFLPAHVRDFFLERESKLSIEDKWQIVPLLVSKEQAQFDRTQYPWSHFAELIRLRNDFVHPKHNRAAYYRAIDSHTWQPLPWNEIPSQLGVKEIDIVYRQTRIPKDPYAIRLEHVEHAKKVADDIVLELDKFLNGQILQNNWHKSDQMQLVYPPGAKLNDLPRKDDPVVKSA